MDAPDQGRTTATLQESLLVEVMGPAGAGKTSLVRALRSKDERLRVGFGVPRRTWFPPLLGKLAILIPVWVASHRRDRWFTWNELKSIAFLDAWLRAARRDPAAASATVIDHGPVYRLARLREFGPSIVRSARVQRWWRDRLEGWLSALDVVVCLDAPDAVLLERLDARGHWYLSEDLPRESKDEFLARYRRAFEEVLEIASPDGPRIVRFRTDRSSPDEIADDVLQVLATVSQGSPRPERLSP